MFNAIAPGTGFMKLYITTTSPYARLARMAVLEKGLADKVEVVEAKTRTPGSPYYGINPSGRVPCLVRDDGQIMEDSQLICAWLDTLDDIRTRDFSKVPMAERDKAVRDVINMCSYASNGHEGIERLASRARYLQGRMGS